MQMYKHKFTYKDTKLCTELIMMHEQEVVKAIKALSSSQLPIYVSTFMAILYGTSFIGHLLWYMGLTTLHTAGSHVVR